MAKANAEATAERVDHLQGMILAGEPNTPRLTFARQAWGVSRSQGYRLLKKAWQQIKNDIDESGIDRQEMLAWCVQTLLETAGQAKAHGTQERWWLPSASSTGCVGWGSTHTPSNWRCLLEVGQSRRVPGHPHQLRHSHAIHAVQRGVDVFTLQATLGHSSSATTGHYVAANSRNSSSLRLG